MTIHVNCVVKDFQEIFNHYIATRETFEIITDLGDILTSVATLLHFLSRQMTSNPPSLLTSCRFIKEKHVEYVFASGASFRIARKYYCILQKNLLHINSTPSPPKKREGFVENLPRGLGNIKCPGSVFTYCTWQEQFPPFSCEC